MLSFKIRKHLTLDAEACIFFKGNEKNGPSRNFSWEYELMRRKNGDEKKKEYEMCWLLEMGTTIFKIYHVNYMEKNRFAHGKGT